MPGRHGLPRLSLGKPPDSPIPHSLHLPTCPRAHLTVRQQVAREAPIHVAAHKGHTAVVKLLAGHASSDADAVAEANEKLQLKAAGAASGAGAPAG